MISIKPLCGSILGTVAFVWLLSPLASLAATPTEGLSLNTSPLPINLVAKPGTTVTTQLRVMNSGTQTDNLQVGLMKFSSYGESGKPILEDRGPGDSYFDWVHFSEPTFVAEPKVWKTITMTINVPKSAAFGYYYAVTFARVAQADTPSVAHQTVVHGATATLVLLEAQVPNAKRQVDVLSFLAEHGIYEFLPASLNVRLHNSGNVHVAPGGNIFISQGGKVVSTLGINAERGNILPNSNRIFSSQWTDGFPNYVTKTLNGAAVLDKKGQVVRELKWDLSNVANLRMGHYTARLMMAYDNGTRDVPIEATVSFWVIPWRLLGAGLLIAALVLFGLISLGRSLWRRFR